MQAEVSCRHFLHETILCKMANKYCTKASNVYKENYQHFKSTRIVLWDTDDYDINSDDSESSSEAYR
jgi:hypothetical protein